MQDSEATKDDLQNNVKQKIYVKLDINTLILSYLNNNGTLFIDRKSNSIQYVVKTRIFFEYNKSISERRGAPHASASAQVPVEYLQRGVFAWTYTMTFTTVLLCGFVLRVRKHTGNKHPQRLWMLIHFIKQNVEYELFTNNGNCSATLRVQQERLYIDHKFMFII